MAILTIFVMFPITPVIDQLHEASTPSSTSMLTSIFTFFPTPYFLLSAG